MHIVFSLVNHTHYANTFDLGTWAQIRVTTLDSSCACAVGRFGPRFAFGLGPVRGYPPLGAYDSPETDVQSTHTLNEMKDAY